MIKPDWSTAPSWANYLAMDEDGEWIWYENEPMKRFSCWESNNGKEQSAGFINDCKKTLEKRP